MLLPSITSKVGISLAFYFAESKHEQSKAVLKAFHHAQMYCITLLNFLCELGISDFPIFALVTTGLRGSILMAWHSRNIFEYTLESGKKEVGQLLLSGISLLPFTQALMGYNVLVDYNLASFDLAIPLEVDSLALAIHRIYLHYDKLKELLMRMDLHRLARDPKFSNWIIVDES